MPASVHEVLSVAGQTCWSTIRHCTSVVVLSVLVLAMPSHVSHSFHFLPFGFVICNFFHDGSTTISGNWSAVSWVLEGDFLAPQKERVASTRINVFLLSHKPTDAVRGLWKIGQSKYQHWGASWTDLWILGAWSWQSRQWEPQRSLVQIGRPLGSMPWDPWSVTVRVPPRSAWWTCSCFWTNPATRKCNRWIWRTSPWSVWRRLAAPFGRSSVMSSWPRRREKNCGIACRSPRGCGGWTGCRGRALDPRICRCSGPWTLVRAFWWPDWNRRPRRRTTGVCKKWLQLIWHFVFWPPNDKDLDPPLEWRE